MAKKMRIRRIKRKKSKATDLLGFQEESGYAEQEGGILEEQDQQENTFGINPESKNQELTASKIPIQQKENKTGMPDGVKTKMETAFQTDFSEVKVFKDSQKPFKLGAKAFAQGNEVHFSKGSFQPDTTKGQNVIGHELAHLIQQKEGKVKTNAYKGGFPVNNQEHLELEADLLGQKAADNQQINKKQEPLKSATSKGTPAQMVTFTFEDKFVDTDKDPTQFPWLYNLDEEGLNALSDELDKFNDNSDGANNWDRTLQSLLFDKKSGGQDQTGITAGRQPATKAKKKKQKYEAPEQNPGPLPNVPAEDADRLKDQEYDRTFPQAAKHGKNAKTANKASDAIGAISFVTSKLGDAALPGLGRFISLACSQLNAIVKKYEAAEINNQIASIAIGLSYIDPNDPQQETFDDFMAQLDKLEVMHNIAEIKALKSALSPLIPAIVSAGEFVASKIVKGEAKKSRGKKAAGQEHIKRTYETEQRLKHQNPSTKLSKAVGKVSRKKQKEMETKKETTRLKDEGFEHLEKMRQ